MTDDDLKLIREIVLHGGKKYTAGNIDRSRYERLVDLGWLTPFVMNPSDVGCHRFRPHCSDTYVIAI